MKKELIFFLFIITCVIVAFIDFHFKTRGLFTLFFDIIISLILIFIIKIKITFKYNLDIENIYALLFFILYPIVINISIKSNVPEKNYILDTFFLISIVTKSLTEELIFRGFWVNYFINEKNKIYSIIYISIGFALLHYFSGTDIVFAFIGSIILSFLYIKTKSILNVFTIHLLSNLYFIYVIPLIF